MIPYVLLLLFLWGLILGGPIVVVILIVRTLKAKSDPPPPVFCRRCGTELVWKSDICPDCGTRHVARPG